MGEHAESFAGEVIDGGPEVAAPQLVRSPYDDAIAAARTCYSPRVVDAEEITDAPARQHRPAHLRRRAPHRLPARDVRVRALGRVAPARLVVPARLPVLQLRAAEPALRAARRGARARAARARRRGAARLRAAIARGLARLPRARPAARAACARDPRRPLAPRATASRGAFGKSVAREAEKKAIETARYVIPIACHTAMVYTVSGLMLHRLRAHGARGRRARSEARRVVERMVAEVRAPRSGLLRARSARRRSEPRTWSSSRVAPRAASATPRRSRPSTSRSTGARSRLVDYGARAPAGGGRRRAPRARPPDLADDEALALALDPRRTATGSRRSTSRPTRR